ncbi:MAG: hypothetical protein Q8835_02590 [Sweet potato little leaf phytoplasma]|nr:hypothetical protein [Sweet potato little leaf phytoplasma]
MYFIFNILKEYSVGRANKKYVVIVEGYRAEQDAINEIRAEKEKELQSMRAEDELARKRDVEDEKKKEKAEKKERRRKTKGREGHWG